MAVDREFRVLVATDGSAAANAAVATAARFPWPARTCVRCVTARQVTREFRRPLLLAGLHRSADVIAAGARRVLSHRWPDADVTIADTTPVTAVLNEAKRFDADSIVLGWRGHGSVRRILMGSTSRGVVRGATCSVLVVRRGQPDVRRIVIGFDGSANAQRAVEFVRKLHPPRGGHVTVSTSVDHISVPTHPLASRGVGATVAAEVRRINAERTARARKEAARVRATLERAGWHVRTSVTAGEPLSDLLASTDPAAADLLVLGARGTSGVRHRVPRREARVSRTYRLPLSKLRAAKRALGAATATETIERPLGMISSVLTSRRRCQYSRRRRLRSQWHRSHT